MISATEDYCPAHIRNVRENAISGGTAGSNHASEFTYANEAFNENSNVRTFIFLLLKLLNFDLFYINISIYLCRMSPRCKMNFDTILMTWYKCHLNIEKLN